MMVAAGRDGSEPRRDKRKHVPPTNGTRSGKQRGEEGQPHIVPPIVQRRPTAKPLGNRCMIVDTRRAGGLTAREVKDRVVTMLDTRCGQLRSEEHHLQIFYHRAQTAKGTNGTATSVAFELNGRRSQRCPVPTRRPRATICRLCARSALIQSRMHPWCKPSATVQGRPALSRCAPREGV